MIRTLLACLLAAASFAPAARAAVVTDVELYGEGVTFGNDAFSTANGFAGQDGLAGQILLTTSGGTMIDAWCIDLFHDVYIGSGQTLHYNGQSLVGSTNGDGGFLSAQQAQEIGGLVDYGNRLVAGGANTDQAAAIQMAIWTTEFPTLTFSAPTAAVADEQADLALAPSLHGGVESYVSLEGTQELVADTNAVPEPAPLGILGVGLLSLGFSRRAPTQRTRNDASARIAFPDGGV